MQRTLLLKWSLLLVVALPYQLNDVQIKQTLVLLLVSITTILQYLPALASIAFLQQTNKHLTTFATTYAPVYSVQSFYVNILRFIIALLYFRCFISLLSFSYLKI